MAILQLHDGTAAELWTSVHSALLTVSGVQDAGAAPKLQPQFFFTQVKSLRGTTVGDMLADHTLAPFSHITELRKAAARDELTVIEIRDRWLPREVPALIAADLAICSEPFWLCPMLSLHRPGWMAAVLHMTFLNEFPFSDSSAAYETNMGNFWPMFYEMTHRKNILMAVACRMTGEQVSWQTGVRVPYVPFLGLYVAARYAPHPAHRVLLFRNNKQHMIAFRSALRLFLAEAEPPCPLR